MHGARSLRSQQRPKTELIAVTHFCASMGWSRGYPPTPKSKLSCERTLDNILHRTLLLFRIHSQNSGWTCFDVLYVFERKRRVSWHQSERNQNDFIFIIYSCSKSSVPVSEPNWEPSLREKHKGAHSSQSHEELIVDKYILLDGIPVSVLTQGLHAFSSVTVVRNYRKIQRRFRDKNFRDSLPPEVEKVVVALLLCTVCQCKGSNSVPIREVYRV